MCDLFILILAIIEQMGILVYSDNNVFTHAIQLITWIITETFTFFTDRKKKWSNKSNIVIS